MKKFILLMLFTTFVFSACGSGTGNSSAPESSSSPSPASSAVHDSTWEDAGTEANEAEDDVIEIKERLFIAQSNDIYLNGQDYLGRTIKYEGIFKKMDYLSLDITVLYVIRYGPGCCGYDGEAGFEVYWEDESTQYPNENDWCEVTGILEEYERNGLRFLRLRLTSLKVLETRGAEFVNT